VRLHYRAFSVVARPVTTTTLVRTVYKSEDFIHMHGSVFTTAFRSLNIIYAHLFEPGVLSRTKQSG
ncbi:MAG: hypothetical protein ACK53Y_19235, partial [bacterium]